jgi:hypothetical protein
MNHFIGLPSLSLFLIIFILLWLWRWYMEQRRQLPGLLRAWRDSLDLPQEKAAERLAELLREKYPKHPINIDPRKFQRWESGKGLPHLETIFMVKQTLSGALYTQAEQTRPDGTKSYAAMFSRDDVREADLNQYEEDFWARQEKRLNAANQPPTRRRSRRSRRSK